jgi:hypothetical protein
MMRAERWVGMAVLLALAISACTTPWTAVRAPAGDFSFSMPRPEPWKEVQQTPFGWAEFNGWRGGDPKDASFNNYHLSYADLKLPEATTADEVIAKMREWIVLLWSGSVVSERPIEVGRARGSEFTLKVKVRGTEDALVRGKVLLVGSRFFRIEVVQVKEAAWQRSRGNRFFESFRLATPAP